MGLVGISASLERLALELRFGKVWYGLGYGVSIPYRGMVWY